MNQIGYKAKTASMHLLGLNENKKNQVLEKLKVNLLKYKDDIFTANAIDIKNGEKQGLSPALIDRLRVTDDTLGTMVFGIDDIIGLDDPIGMILDEKNLDNGLNLKKIRVPLGVVGIIYESRPNVTVDAFALSFKAGNASILKGGKEAIETNKVFEKIIRETLKEENIDENIVQLIKDTTRKSTKQLMKLNAYVDVLIPRGSQGLIDAVLKESTIPVIETGAGNCHIYIDASADLDKALKIVENAKLQRPGVCNAVESLVVHESVAGAFIPKLIQHIPEVTVYGDEKARLTDPRILSATPDDFYQEYLDKSLSVKIVKTLGEAIVHINTHHTAHSDAIITEDQRAADAFTRSVDAAAVYVNASTRFTDGFVFGLGAEIGISTQKLHARGPMGLEALTTYKYIIKGNGQVR